MNRALLKLEDGTRVLDPIDALPNLRAVELASRYLRQAKRTLEDLHYLFTQTINASRPQEETEVAEGARQGIRRILEVLLEGQIALDEN